MKRLIAVLAIISVAAVATAQQMTISGTVIDAVTREPIENAAVHAMHAGSVYTNSAGEYTLVPMRAGAYVVYANATGYEPAVYPETVYVEPGQAVEGIDFELQPAAPVEYGAISGTITDASTTAPIEGAWVHTMHQRGAYTNADGFYTLESLPAGDYVVGATAEGYQGGFYPDTVAVVGGQTTEGIDFALVPCVPGEYGAIAGTITDAQTNEPIAGARVHTFHQAEAWTNESGYYLLENLPAGDYIVGATADGYMGGFYPDTVTVVGGQTTEGIDFALEPCVQRYGSLGGEVTDAGTGLIIRGAIVRATAEGIERQVTQGIHGYNIGMLPAGNYWVSAEAPGYEPGAYGDSVEVVAGQRTGDVDFTLAAGGQGFGAVAGTVTNAATGLPIVGAHVVALGSASGRTNTDPDGNYLIDELAPGTYVVRAMMRGFEPSAPETVAVEAGQTVEDVDFALEPMGGGAFGAIGGTVVDSATGEPLFHAHVFVRSAHGQGMAYTDSTGNYLIERLPVGTYLVRASAMGHYPAVYPESVAVAEGQTTEGIDFALRDCPRLQAGLGGYLVDGYSQDEIEGATVIAIGTEQSYQTQTDANGEYLFAALEPGDYRIQVSASGYATGVYAGLAVLEPGQVEAFTTPWVYPLNGVADLPVQSPARAEMSVGPNPFRTAATVRWMVPVGGQVSLRVVDKSGRVVTTLQSGIQAAGRYSASWNGTDANGRRVASGVYFYRLDAPGVTGIEKVVLVTE
jgi:protocatechuate 3,4-dioxygenase beta subunit